MMNLREQLISLSKLYCKHTKTSTKTLSKRMFGRSNKLDQLTSSKNAAKLHTDTWEHAVKHLSENWPSDIQWPDFVERTQVEEPAE